MSAKIVAIATVATGIYGANKASSAARSSAAAQERSAGVLAGQADRAAQLSYDLGQERLQFERDQYDEMRPLAQRAADQQFASQSELMDMAREDRDFQQSTFQPLEQGLVDRAREFDTDARREQMAQQAAADSARAFEGTQAQTSRGLSRMGVGPGSGAAMAQMNQNALAAASGRAGAMTGSRQQSEQLGYARMLDAAGLGRNLTGLSQGAYSTSVGAGSAGINTAMAPGNQFGSGMGSAANTMLAGSGQALNAYSQLYGGATRMAAGAQDNYMGALGGLVGMGGNIAAAQFGRT